MMDVTRGTVSLVGVAKNATAPKHVVRNLKNVKRVVSYVSFKEDRGADPLGGEACEDVLSRQAVLRVT